MTASLTDTVTEEMYEHAAELAHKAYLDECFVQMKVVKPDCAPPYENLTEDMKAFDRRMAMYVIDFVAPLIARDLHAEIERLKFQLQAACDVESKWRNEHSFVERQFSRAQAENARLRAIAAKANQVLNVCSPFSRAVLMQEMRDMLDDNHKETAAAARALAEGEKG